jgi:hypothetical protein
MEIISYIAYLLFILKIRRLRRPAEPGAENDGSRLYFIITKAAQQQATKHGFFFYENRKWNMQKKTDGSRRQR